ncbi:sulfotransferase [Streptomyces sp. CA-181903]|uniref:MmyB family transcriptional regulator n=1 Tax=Streptomyces sp. CA-181903 TaxID=3240055 RepID=UPI003D8D832B
MNQKPPDRDYQELLRRYRAKVTRELIGLPPRISTRRSRSANLRQSDMDEALRGGTGTYQKLENGVLAPSRELFLRVARTLHFSDHHLRIAHLDLFRTDPVLPMGPVSPHWHRWVGSHTEMAFVCSPAGDVIAANDAFTRMFPTGGPPSNVTEWALLSAEAREEVLQNWERDWAPHLLADLRLALARHPDDPALQKLRDAVRGDSRTRHIEDAPTGVGDEPRQLRHARRGVVTVRVLTSYTRGVTTVTLLSETPSRTGAATSAERRR